MKATREQCLAMVDEARAPTQKPADWIGMTHEQIERLVHLAQQFERDQLRAQLPHDYVGDTDIPLFTIPETLE